MVEVGPDAYGDALHRSFLSGGEAEAGIHQPREQAAAVRLWKKVGEDDSVRGVRSGRSECECECEGCLY